MRLRELIYEPQARIMKRLLLILALTKVLLFCVTVFFLSMKHDSAVPLAAVFFSLSFLFELFECKKAGLSKEEENQ